MLANYPNTLPRCRDRLAALVATLALVALWPGAMALAGAGSAEDVPHLDRRGRADYEAFRDAQRHRAFVIAPGGAWSWVGGSQTPEAALESALENCTQFSPFPCVPYAVDNDVVFDDKAWPTLWRPYLKRDEAVRAPTGTARGERFPDLAFSTADGKPRKLSDLAGSVVVVHFWGSWCGPCVRELPELEELFAVLKDRRDVRFVFMQVREDIETARKWATDRGLSLPLYDSGARGEEDEFLRLASGKRLADREIARVFPTTYVLDRQRIVVYRRVGPAERWVEYAPFLRDVATGSGR